MGSAGGQGCETMWAGGSGTKQVTGDLGLEVKRSRRQDVASRKEPWGYLRNGMKKGMDIGKHKSFQKKNLAYPASSPSPRVLPG